MHVNEVITKKKKKKFSWILIHSQEEINPRSRQHILGEGDGGGGRIQSQLVSLVYGTSIL